MIGGRKFIGFLVISVLLTILVLANKITGADFTLFITANFGIYVGGNVGDTLVNGSNPIM